MRYAFPFLSLKQCRSLIETFGMKFLIEEDHLHKRLLPNVKTQIFIFEIE